MADLVRIFCFNNSYHATPFEYYYAKIRVYSKTVNAVFKNGVFGAKNCAEHVTALVRPEARWVDSAPPPPPYFYDWDLMILRIKC